MDSRGFTNDTFRTVMKTFANADRLVAAAGFGATALALAGATATAGFTIAAICTNVASEPSQRMVLVAPGQRTRTPATRLALDSTASARVSPVVPAERR